MYEFEENSERRRRLEVMWHSNMSPTDPWNRPYTFWEGAWGILLIIGIFAINISVLWVVSRSRELWKPRHLWMACLCITDLFVGGHKGLGLLLLVWPKRELCVLQRTTLGVPYVVNMLLLTLLSLDRFVAVRYPFFYSSSISNKHVGIGFLIVLITGSSLAAASVILGLRDPICRAQSLQLAYLTIVLAICSILTLFFNSAVLRIAKKQLNAIYAQEPSFKGKRRVSVVCTNCGYKNETYVNALLPMVSCPLGSDAEDGHNVELVGTMSSEANPLATPTKINILPLNEVMLGPLDIQISCDPVDQSQHHLLDEITSPLVKTVSLPVISDNSPPDSCLIPPEFVEMDIGEKAPSMSNLTDDQKVISTVGGQFQSLPRSKSLVTCHTNKIVHLRSSTAPRLQLFRNLHFARAHMFHVGRLFPSIRFARTVLLIMIPMWVFILPIVTIIPLHRSCEDGNKSELNCNLVETLWRYLIIHMRSILPLQAILDTLIYAFGSKEFRFALVKLIKKGRTKK